MLVINLLPLSSKSTYIFLTSLISDLNAVDCFFIARRFHVRFCQERAPEGHYNAERGKRNVFPPGVLFFSFLSQ